MEKFNLERALAGEPVITRDGKEVTEIHHFKTYSAEHSVYAVVEGILKSFTIEGEYNSYSPSESTNDLFMKPKVIEGWVNVYQKRDVLLVGESWTTKENAEKNIGKNNNYIKTIKITNEV